MPSFTTIYRAVVMIAVGVIVVKGWQLYGPAADEMQTFGLRALDLASAAWNDLKPQESDRSIARDDPRLSAPQAFEPPSSTVPASFVEPAPLLPASGTNAQLSTAGEIPAEPREPGAVDLDDASALPADVADRLPALYSRLAELGVSDPQLAPWGSSGQMYRFHCRAALAESSSAARHFEAVAAEPIAAVEQVLTKLESWRTGGGGPAVELR